MDYSPGKCPDGAYKGITACAETNDFASNTILFIIKGEQGEGSGKELRISGRMEAQAGITNK